MQVTLIHNPDAGDDRQPSGDELLKLIRRADIRRAINHRKTRIGVAR
jgi:hypothetical protein